MTRNHQDPVWKAWRKRARLEWLLLHLWTESRVRHSGAASLCYLHRGQQGRRSRRIARLWAQGHTQLWEPLGLQGPILRGQLTPTLLPNNSSNSKILKQRPPASPLHQQLRRRSSVSSLKTASPLLSVDRDPVSPSSPSLPRRRTTTSSSPNREQRSKSLRALSLQPLNNSKRKWVSKHLKTTVWKMKLSKKQVIGSSMKITQEVYLYAFMKARDLSSNPL